MWEHNEREPDRQSRTESAREKKETERGERDRDRQI